MVAEWFEGSLFNTALAPEWVRVHSCLRNLLPCVCVCEVVTALTQQCTHDASCVPQTFSYQSLFMRILTVCKNTVNALLRRCVHFTSSVLIENWSELIYSVLSKWIAAVPRNRFCHICYTTVVLPSRSRCVQLLSYRSTLHNTTVFKVVWL